ncbi:tetratricopeptide repeat protein [Terricaulis sp.]|uniref:tetratricopeptide repeat protein n=1 Tax=Terricaulis sp. TaxID=2768686 RepID=UPI003783D975
MYARGGLLLAGLLLSACTPTALQTPENSRAYADFLVARVANLDRDHRAASDRYYAALQRAPHNQDLLQGALVSSLAAGEVQRARQVARMAPPGDAPGYAHLVRAADALNAGRWRQARQEIEKVEGTAAEMLTARMLLTWARTGDGAVDDVTVELQQMSSVRPYGGLFAFQQGMALDYAGRTEEALAAYATAESGGLWLPSGVERHADALYRAGRREEAAGLLQSFAQRQNPALEQALARGGAASERLTAANGAAVGLYGLAVIYLQENDSTNGLATLTLALMLDPQLDAARIAFAEEQNELGHGVEARAALSQVPRSSPYSISARVMEALIVADEGQRDEAIVLAQAAAEGGDVRARRGLADLYRRFQRYGDAEPLYTQLIAEQPNDWRLFFSRGVSRERLGRWPEAEADFRRALELSPDQPDVMNYLGYTWVDRGEHLDEGLAMIQRAVQVRPLSGAIIDSLGWAYFRMGRYDEALEYLERAVELEPADATLNEHLGDLYWRMDRRIEARFQWERALTLAPDNPQALQQKIDHGLPPMPPARSARQ